MNWYILCTRLYHEKKVAEKLSSLGFEVYLPAQRVRKKWSDRIKTVDQIVITRTVFVHCEDADRKKTFVDQNLFYMMDRTTGKVAIVPDNQLNTFRALLSQTDIPVDFIDHQLQPGEKVRISNDIFDAVDAEVTMVEGKEKVFVRIDLLGCAILEVSTDDLVPIK